MDFLDEDQQVEYNEYQEQPAQEQGGYEFGGDAEDFLSNDEHVHHEEYQTDQHAPAQVEQKVNPIRYVLIAIC